MVSAVGRLLRAMLVASGVLLAAGAVPGDAPVSAGAQPRTAVVWSAAPGDHVALVPVLDAGVAGWCMQTVTRVVTATATESSRACPVPSTTSGPILAEQCQSDGGMGAVVFVLTRSEVASVSIAGSARVPTAANLDLPSGLRAVVLQAPADESELSFSKHCPAVTGFDAGGDALPAPAMRSSPLAVRLRRSTWAHPQRPPLGVCGIKATRLPLGTVAWEGSVATAIGPVGRLLGRAFVSCARTVYVHRGGHYISAAVLLDASHPGATPSPLPGMKPFAGHPGIFETQGSEGSMVARRIACAWVVATEEVNGLAVPAKLLDDLRVIVHL